LKNNWQPFASVMLMPLISYMERHWSQNQFLLTSFICFVFDNTPEVNLLAPKAYKTSSGRLRKEGFVSLVFAELQKQTIRISKGEVTI
jgi:hypothetical protein